MGRVSVEGQDAGGQHFPSVVKCGCSDAGCPTHSSIWNEREIRPPLTELFELGAESYVSSAYLECSRPVSISSFLNDDQMVARGYID